MNQNEPIFLNLYIRDTDTHCKNTNIVANQQIMRVKKLISFYENQHFFQNSYHTQFSKSLIERMFSSFLCLLCRDSDDRHQKTNLIRMMKETNIQSQVTSTIAGDDGEAVAKSEENAKKKVPEKPNEGLEKPADAGWYVAVVRVNCETRIADSIRINLNHNHVWFDYWIPKVKVVYIDKRSNKRKVKEKLFLSTFIFCNVSPRQLDNIRFRSDVYKMLTMPGQRKIYQIPDQVIANYRYFVENDEEPVLVLSGKN